MQPLRRRSVQPLRRDRALKRGLSVCFPAGQTACLSARLRPCGFVPQRSCLTVVIVCDAVALLVAGIGLHLALCSGDGASDRLAAIALGTACIAFAVVVFVFFTAWLLSPVRLWEAGQLNDEVVPRCWQYGCSRRLIALGQAPSFLAQCWSGHMYQLVCACFLGVVCLQVGSRARASWVSFVSISPNLARH